MATLEEIRDESWNGPCAHGDKTIAECNVCSTLTLKPLLRAEGLVAALRDFRLC